MTVLIEIFFMNLNVCSVDVHILSNEAEGNQLKLNFNESKLTKITAAIFINNLNFLGDLFYIDRK